MSQVAFQSQLHLTRGMLCQAYTHQAAEYLLSSCTAVPVKPSRFYVQFWNLGYEDLLIYQVRGREFLPRLCSLHITGLAGTTRYALNHLIVAYAMLLFP
jgi:hypothetical protein